MRYSWSGYMGQAGSYTHLIQLLHILCAAAYLCLAVYIVVKRRAALNLGCAGVLICFASWSLALAVSHSPGVPKATAGLFYNIGALAWGSFASFAAFFTAAFLRPRLLRSAPFWLALVLPPAAVIYAQWSGHLVADYVAVPWGWAFVWRLSWWTAFYYGYYGLYMTTVVTLLLRAYRRDPDPVRRRQAGIFVATAVPSLLLSTVSDVVLPWAGIHALPNMAPDFIVIWGVGLVYAIAKLGMLELTPAGAADLIVASMSDALLLVNPRDEVALVNPAACALLGYEEQELQGLPLLQLFPDAVRQAQREQVNNASPGGRCDLLLQRKDGAQLQVIFSHAQVRGGSDTELGMVCLATDITERKRAEASLRQARDQLESRVAERTEELQRTNEQLEREVAERQRSEARYRLLVESMQEGLWVVDDQGRTTFTNPRLAQILGGDVAALAGRRLSEFTADEAGAQACEACLARTRRGERAAFDGDLLDGKGRRVSAIVQLAPLCDEQGAYEGAVLTVMDDTERQRMRSRLAQSDRMASLGLLAAGVGHEINNPLTYVLDNLRHVDATLRQRVPRPDGEPAHEEQELRDNVGAALEGARRVWEIVKDLRTFARVDDRPEPVDVNQTLRSAISMAQNEIKYRARIVEALGQIPLVRAGEGRLSQVFLNLLVNAAHAIEEGDPGGNAIHVRTWREGDEVLAEVKDTGRGIPPQQLERLFDPFFTTKEAGTGSGLGLSICHQIISDYGGKVDVESTVGEGSRFVVRLPALPDQARPPKEARAKANAPAKATRPWAHAPAGARVLVIDDEPGIHLVLRRMLGRGFRVVEAASGEEAKQLLEQDRDFAVILCDLMMPGLSGMALYEWLQAQDAALAGRVVFMTGGVFTPRAEELLRRAPNPTLPKPFDPEQVLEVVGRVLEGSGSSG